MIKARAKNELRGESFPESNEIYYIKKTFVVPLINNDDDDAFIFPLFMDGTTI